MLLRQNLIRAHLQQWPVPALRWDGAVSYNRTGSLVEKKKKKKNENCDGETDSHGEEETEDGPPAQILGENPADDLATDDVIVNRALENASLSK